MNEELKGKVVESVEYTEYKIVVHFTDGSWLEAHEWAHFAEDSGITIKTDKRIYQETPEWEG